MSTTPPDQRAPSTLDRSVLIIASVVVLGAIMSILDVTVVNVAISTLAQEFETSLTTIQWVASGYTLALATAIPLTAWGTERFGTKRLYMVSIALFIAGSALAGTAWDATSLIAFRVLQGLGGGMLMPIGMTILTRAAGPNRVGRLMSVIGIPMLLGPVFGPMLGGWLVESLSWRWIFFINLPIGLLALVLAARVLPRDGAGARPPLDFRGLAMLSPGLALLIYGLAESGASGGFGHAQVLVPLVAGALLLVTFVWHGLRTRVPLINLRLFNNRVFAASMATVVLVTLTVFGGMLLLPLYLQIVRGESAFATGLLLAPQGLGAMITMPIAGRLADRTGVGRIVPVGLATITCVFWWLTGIDADTPYLNIAIALFFMGLGMGMTMMPTMAGAMQTLRRASIPSATTTLNIAQQVGTSIGTALMSVILAGAITSRLGTGPAGAGGGIGELAQLPPEQFGRIQPSLADAFGATYWWGVGFTGVAVLVALALLPKRKPAPVEEDGQVTAAEPPVVAH